MFVLSDGLKEHCLETLQHIQPLVIQLERRGGEGGGERGGRGEGEGGEEGGRCEGGGGGRGRGREV